MRQLWRLVREWWRLRRAAKQTEVVEHEAVEKAMAEHYAEKQQEAVKARDDWDRVFYDATGKGPHAERLQREAEEAEKRRVLAARVHGALALASAAGRMGMATTTTYVIGPTFDNSRLVPARRGLYTPMSSVD